jgi:poly(A) polymerase
MANPPDANSQSARQAAIAIVRKLREAGHIAYFAGGCVRDELLGLSPTDYDVATDAPPDRIRSMFRRTAEVGAAFGVVLVTPQADEVMGEGAVETRQGAKDARHGVPSHPRYPTVEVATFRSDGPYTDRRRPDVVRFSDPASDAHRRDFTINALFLDPLPKGGGLAEIIDYVGGREDLRRRTIRAVGDPDARLAEDHLRALRAVRLAARLGFEIEPRTAAAIRQHARELQGVSRERIGDEIRRMLTEAPPQARQRAVQLLSELELDAPVLMEPAAPLADRLLEQLRVEASYPAALAAWALQRGLHLQEPAVGPLVERWREALCLSNDERDDLASILQNLVHLEGEWPSWPVARQKRVAGAPGSGFAEAVLLLRARDPQRAATVGDRLRELEGTLSGIRPGPLLTGDDLIAAGFRPGPGFKGTLDRVYDAQLEDRITTREQAMELARTLGV